MQTNILNPPAVVQSENAELSVSQMIEQARLAVNSCQWVVGEMAAAFVITGQKGRTDADFAAKIGLGKDSVRQAREVWQTYADVKDGFKSISFSHFVVARKWDDEAECLAWAEENQATVKEMKAWRAMQHGDDLTIATQGNDGWGEGETTDSNNTKSLNKNSQSNEGASTDAGDAASEAASEDSTSHQDGDDNVRTDPADGTTPTARVTGDDMEKQTRKFQSGVRNMEDSIDSLIAAANDDQIPTIEAVLLCKLEAVRNR